MGRPRQFEENEALQAAMVVFWRHGYEATTYKLLERATGVRGRSLVNVFGDKDAMFVRVLRLYREAAADVIAQVFAPPGADAIATMFGALTKETESPDDVRNAGCLMVNTVFELGKTKPGVRAEVDAYRAMWRDTFETSLAASGIDDAPARAEFLVGILWGVLSQIRLTGSMASASAMAGVAVDTVRGWQTAAGARG